MFTLKETAALLKSELRRTFPGVKFSVTSSGWAFTSINVSWLGGPPATAVQAVTARYERTTFGGAYGQDRVDTAHVLTAADGRTARPGSDVVFLQPH